MQAGARIEAIAVPEPGTIYVGVGSGNLWKSDDNGITWTPIFEHESTCSIGDIAVALSDPDLLFVLGNRAYRSSDSGRILERVGEHIVQIHDLVVHPRDPVLVAGTHGRSVWVLDFTRMVPDEQIPGTMNVGHTIPVVVEALVFITIVEVQSLTLVLMIAASVAGAWLGSGIVASLPRRGIQIGLGVALTAAAVFMALGQFDAFPLGGEALGLNGAGLAVAVLAIGALGALMPIGVGLYAPCMILVSILGMNPKAAFPIMMGACAFLMPVASARFVRCKRYAARPALGLALGGIPGVVIAAFVVKSLPLSTVRWLVVVVVVYTAIVMLRAARNRGGGEQRRGL